MSFSIEALAMAGVDYNEWGMDYHEWERIEMGPPPPHLCVDDYEEEHEHEYESQEDERDVEVVINPRVENHLEDVFNERNKEGDDTFRMQSPKGYNKFDNNDHGIKRLKMMVVVIMMIRFLRRRILLTVSNVSRLFIHQFLFYYFIYLLFISN